MANGAASLSDLRESEWTRAITTAAVGIGIFILAAIVVWVLSFMESLGNALIYLRAFLVLAMPIGLGIAGWGVYRGLQARKVAGIAFPCPYCGMTSQFAEAPTEDYDCEHCQRTVRFDNGTVVTIHLVVCKSCQSEHKVPANAVRYVCDRCNRPLNLGKTSKGAPVPEEVMRDALLQNYDVLLIAFDRRREDELAFKVQNLLLTTLPEARRLIEMCGAQTPLVVGQNLPERKADSIRRQLQELGATVTLKPSSALAARGR